MTSRASYRAIGVAMAIAGVVCFSLRPILIKLAYGYGVDPITLLALRMIFSLPFFLAAAAWVGRDAKRAPLTRGDAWAIVVLGFVGYYFSSFVDFLGLQYISAGLGRLILFMYPTLVVILSAAFLHKRPAAREVVALGVTYSGVALVMANAAQGANVHLALGAALCFASAAGYAVYLVAGSQVGSASARCASPPTRRASRAGSASSSSCCCGRCRRSPCPDRSTAWRSPWPS